MELESIEALAALADPLRHRLYEFVRREGRPVSREEAALEAGISRKLAAFHLDTLERRGLLRSIYARPAGRPAGRGAGRSSKLYEPSGVEVQVSLPERRYELAATLLLLAVREQQDEETSADAALRAARDAGMAIGESVRAERHLRAPGPERALSLAAGELERLGYAPRRADDGSIRVRNCPFARLAEQAPELMCAMNREFVEGIVRGLGNATVRVTPAADPEACCVGLAPPAGRAE